MKFMKRAYVKVWQNCPEDEREDTTITLLDHEDANELNSILVALLYLLERHAFVNSMEDFDILEHCLTTESFDPSYCPRCGALIWPDTTLRYINGQPENDSEYYQRILEIYKNNPDPLFCHNCGQHFKYVGQDQLAYKHQSNRADILRTLKLKAETQPTFDLAGPNQ